MNDYGGKTMKKKQEKVIELRNDWSQSTQKGFYICDRIKTDLQGNSKANNIQACWRNYQYKSETIGENRSSFLTLSKSNQHPCGRGFDYTSVFPT